MYLPILIKSAESYFFQYFPSRFTQKLRNLEMFHSVDFGKLLFSEILTNFPTAGPFWPHIDWTLVCASPWTVPGTFISLNGGTTTVSVMEILTIAGMSRMSPMQDGFIAKIQNIVICQYHVWYQTIISWLWKSVPRGQMNNIPALVQIMAWRLPVDEPLSEPMMARLLTHICVTRPQWVKPSPQKKPLRDWIYSA